MKRPLLTLCLALLGSLASYSQSCPISLNTTEIIYSYHTGSGEAIYTTVTIREDYVLWNYNEARNNFRILDSCKCSKEEFCELIKSLSKIEFSASSRRSPVGGGGFSYSFISDSKVYLRYDESSLMSGNSDQVSSLIQEYIEAHMPKNDELLDKLPFTSRNEDLYDRVIRMRKKFLERRHNSEQQNQP